MKPGRDVEAPGPFRQDAEAHQIPVRHCCRRVDDGLPELLKDPGGIDLFPEVQIKLFPVLLFRQTDPLVQDLVLGVQDMRGRGTKDKFGHQFRMTDGNDLCHHPSLGRAEQEGIFQSQFFHGFRRVLRHIFHRIGIGQIFPPVEYIDGVVLRQGSISLSDGLLAEKDALDAQSGKDHKGAFSAAETEIIHGKGFGDDLVGKNIHRVLSFSYIS